MPNGLEIYDGLGNVIFNASRVTRYHSTIFFTLTTTSPVAFTVLGLVANADWLVVPRITGTESGLYMDNGNLNLTITLSTNTVTVQNFQNSSFTTGYLTILRF